MTYWEFNRHRPLYLKLGAGWLFNTLGDLYVTTQHPGTGYLGCPDMRTTRAYTPTCATVSGVETPAGRMLNRVGVAAGKYFRTPHPLRAKWPTSTAATVATAVSTYGAHVPVIGYGEMGVGVRFGDDFRDPEPSEFRHRAAGALFDDYSERMTEGAQRGRQTHLARRCGARTALRPPSVPSRAPLRAHGAGQKSLSDYRQDLRLRRGGPPRLPGGGAVDFELGADYRYDKRAHAAGRHYVTPYLRMRFDTGAKGFSPLIEADGTLCDNSFRTLSRLNPYVEPGVCGATAARWSTPSGWVPTAPRRTTASPIASSWVRPCARTSSSGP